MSRSGACVWYVYRTCAIIHVYVSMNTRVRGVAKSRRAGAGGGGGCSKIVFSPQILDLPQNPGGRATGVDFPTVPLLKFVATCHRHLLGRRLWW